MKIAIITGGETGEREISVMSAKNIKSMIDFADTTTFIFPEEKERFIAQAKEFDLAIPVIHGLGGEDGSLQRLLGDLKLLFIFSGIEAHAIAINKRETKRAAEPLGIVSPKETNTFPLFAKPVRGGSSVASKLCSSQEELNELKKKNPDIEFITEEPIKGREFTVGVIEYGGKTFALPVIEIIPKGEFFDFENKYNPEKLAQEICPADIDNALRLLLQTQALAIHNHLKIRHISRSDFIVGPENKIYFLEINTIPGMTNTSLIPKMLNAADISLQGVLREWCMTSLSVFQAVK